MPSATTRNGNQDGAYLTKQVLNRAVRKGVKQAAAEAMKTAGSVVTTDGEWVVRRHQDGRIEQLRKLDRKSPRGIAYKLRTLVGA